MIRKKIAKVLFWIGVAALIIYFIMVWIQNQVTSSNTPETLIGTGWGYREIYFNLLSLALLLGICFSLIGALIYSGKKGSFFWLLALVPIIGMNIGLSWDPSQHFPVVYGIGAAIISLSYLGLLWGWIVTHKKYVGIAKTGKEIQLLGYSFLYITALFLCNYIGNPMNPGTAGFPSPAWSWTGISIFRHRTVCNLDTGIYSFGRPPVPIAI